MRWLEVEVETRGNEIHVRARGSRGERPAPHVLASAVTSNSLPALAQHVGRAVHVGRPLSSPAIELAQTIHVELFRDELRELLARLTDISAGGDGERSHCVLVRFFLQNAALQAFPWEVLCKSGSPDAFLGTDPRLLVARGVSSLDPWAPREVLEAVRLLVIAPGPESPAVEALRFALDTEIAEGKIEWLDPIMGPDIGAKVLFERLRRGKAPHIVHFIGHGTVDDRGRPALRLADDDEEEVWLPVDVLARELALFFLEELRLVVLEACEGAKPGVFGSAGEILARAGADAVVAHLYPVRADVARGFSVEMYRALTSHALHGDIGSSVSAARRTLANQNASAFSPVLYLRGADSILFDFSQRVPVPSIPRPNRGSLAPALQIILDKPPYSVVVGDMDQDRVVLKQELLTFLRENGDTPDAHLPLSALTQRCMLRFGDEVLQSLFQQAIAGTLQENPPPLIDALAAVIPPGVHVTLLWRPHLERAIAAKQPKKNIYAVQVSLSSTNVRPRIVKRPAGAAVWKMEPVLPKQFNVDEDIIVLRMYGGYSPEARPIFSQPVVTEDDHIHGMLGDRPPQWLDELLATTRMQPGLCLGLSVLDWRNRLLLRWLYDERPPPKDSLVILPANADAAEPEIWLNGGGLPGTARIAAVLEDPARLAAQIQAYAKEGGA